MKSSYFSAKSSSFSMISVKSSYFSMISVKIIVFYSEISSSSGSSVLLRSTCVLRAIRVVDMALSVSIETR